MYNVKELTHDDIVDFVASQIGISRKDVQLVQCGPGGWCVHIRQWDEFGVRFRIERRDVKMEVVSAPEPSSK